MEATTDVWELPTESARRVGHPAPFPVELPQRLIELYTYPGDLVLDPFMGSGSTAVAAVRTGRHYVGYDTDPEYVEAATARVDAERITLDRPPAIDPAAARRRRRVGPRPRRHGAGRRRLHRRRRRRPLAGRHRLRPPGPRRPGPPLVRRRGRRLHHRPVGAAPGRPALAGRGHGPHHPGPRARVPGAGADPGAARLRRARPPVPPPGRQRGPGPRPGRPRPRSPSSRSCTRLTTWDPRQYLQF